MSSSGGNLLSYINKTKRAIYFVDKIWNYWTTILILAVDLILTDKLITRIQNANPTQLKPHFNVDYQWPFWFCESCQEANGATYFKSVFLWFASKTCRWEIALFAFTPIASQDPLKLSKSAKSCHQSQSKNSHCVMPWTKAPQIKSYLLKTKLQRVMVLNPNTNIIILVWLLWV